MSEPDHWDGTLRIERAAQQKGTKTWERNDADRLDYMGFHHRDVRGDGGKAGEEMMDARLHQITKALRRNMPRNADVVELCDKAERMERELIVFAQTGKVQEPPVKTIDERVADCPVCTARRNKDAKRKQKVRIRKTIPGQR